MDFSLQNLVSTAGDVFTAASPIVGKVVAITNPDPSPPPGGTSAPVVPVTPKPVVLPAPPGASTLTTTHLVLAVVAVGALAWYFTRKA